MGFFDDLEGVLNAISDGVESVNDEVIITEGLYKLNSGELDYEERAELLEKMARAARHFADFMSNE